MHACEVPQDSLLFGRTHCQFSTTRVSAPDGAQGLQQPGACSSREITDRPRVHLVWSCTPSSLEAPQQMAKMLTLKAAPRFPKSWARARLWSVLNAEWHLANIEASKHAELELQTVKQQHVAGGLVWVQRVCPSRMQAYRLLKASDSAQRVRHTSSRQTKLSQALKRGSSLQDSCMDFEILI